MPVSLPAALLCKLGLLAQMEALLEPRVAQILAEAYRISQDLGPREEDEELVLGEDVEPDLPEWERPPPLDRHRAYGELKARLVTVIDAGDAPVLAGSGVREILCRALAEILQV